MSMRFQPGEGPSRGLLRYCENFADGSLAALIVPVFPPCCHYPPGEEISRTRLTAAYNLFRGGKQFICDANYERGSSILGAHQHLPIQRHTILTSQHKKPVSYNQAHNAHILLQKSAIKYKDASLHKSNLPTAYPGTRKAIFIKL